MFILIVNGVPVLKLGKRSEFPPRQGKEAWMVVDKKGRTIASYHPA